MNKCYLCKTNEANQTGSHLFSAFLLESMVGKRDAEKAFFISGGADLEYRKNVGAEPIKEDHIFCRGCEQRLAYLESYISQEFTQKISNDNFRSNFLEGTQHNTNYTTPLHINPIAFRLMFYSIIWRASISNKKLFSAFQLPLEVMNEIRQALNELLPPYKNYKVKMKQSKWLKVLEGKKTVIPNIQFVMIKGVSNDLTNRSSTFIHPLFKNPYHILLNEYLFLCFLSSQPRFENDFFNLCKENGNMSDFLIKANGELKIIKFDSKKWDRVLDILKEAAVKQKVNAIRESLSSAFFQTVGRLPTQQELELLYNEYLNNNHR